MPARIDPTLSGSDIVSVYAWLVDHCWKWLDGSGTSLVGGVK